MINLGEQLLTYEMETFSRKTNLDLAYSAKNYRLFEHPKVHILLQSLWHGGLHNSKYRDISVYISLLCIPVTLWIPDLFVTFKTKFEIDQQARTFEEHIADEGESTRSSISTTITTSSSSSSSSSNSSSSTGFSIDSDQLCNYKINKEYNFEEDTNLYHKQYSMQTNHGSNYHYNNSGNSLIPKRVRTSNSLSTAFYKTAHNYSSYKRSNKNSDDYDLVSRSNYKKSKHFKSNSSLFSNGTTVNQEKHDVSQFDNTYDVETRNNTAYNTRRDSNLTNKNGNFLDRNESVKSFKLTKRRSHKQKRNSKNKEPNHGHSSKRKINKYQLRQLNFNHRLEPEMTIHEKRKEFFSAPIVKQSFQNIFYILFIICYW